MASSTDIATAMTSAVAYLYKIVGPILIFIGTIGGILNLVVFTQKNLRKNPCSMYFIAYNLVNLMQIYASLLGLMVNVGYNINLTANNIHLCRLDLYITTVFNVLSSFYLVLASFDRILITSPNALTRQRSTLRLAYICIIGGTLFWALFHSQVLVFSEIIEVAPNYFQCYFQPGTYIAFTGYYSIIKEILAISLMIICGLWAIKNIRSMRRVAPLPSLSINTNTTGVEGNQQSASSKDRQLIFMLRMDITIYGLFCFVFAIFLLYQQITEDYIKSPQRAEIEVAIRNLCLLSIDVPLCTSFYTNLIASKTFRKEVKKVLSWERLFRME